MLVSILVKCPAFLRKCSQKIYVGKCKNHRPYLFTASVHAYNSQQQKSRRSQPSVFTLVNYVRIFNTC